LLCWGKSCSLLLTVLLLFNKAEIPLFSVDPAFLQSVCTTTILLHTRNPSKAQLCCSPKPLPLSSCYLLASSHSFKIVGLYSYFLSLSPRGSYLSCTCRPISHPGEPLEPFMPFHLPVYKVLLRAKLSL